MFQDLEWRTGPGPGPVSNMNIPGRYHTTHHTPLLRCTMVVSIYGMVGVVSPRERKRDGLDRLDHMGSAGPARNESPTNRFQWERES